MKRRIIAGASIACLALSLVGCGSGGDKKSNGPVELNFWHGYTEADGKILDKIVDDFNKSQSDVKIKTTTKTWAVIGDTLLPALSSNKGPDIVALEAANLPIYASKGAIADLDDYYETKNVKEASLNKEAVRMVQVKGKHYAIPTGFVPRSVFYNKEIFKKAGITEFPKTWNQWLEVSKKLTIDENKDGKPEQYGVALPDHESDVWPTLFFGNGGDLVKDGKSVIDSPENLATLEYWKKAIVEDKISPTGISGIDADKLFSSKKVAMIIGGPWMASVSKENNIDYGIAAVPAGPKGQAAAAIGITAAVTKQADKNKQEAAQKFFDYFLSKKVSIEWALGSGWSPLRTDISPDEVSQNDVVKSLTEIANTARSVMPGETHSADILTAVNELTQKTIGGGDPKELLKKADDNIKSVLSK